MAEQIEVTFPVGNVKTQIAPSADNFSLDDSVRSSVLGSSELSKLNSLTEDLAKNAMIAPSAYVEKSVAQKPDILSEVGSSKDLVASPSGLNDMIEATNMIYNGMMMTSLRVTIVNGFSKDTKAMLQAQ